MIDRRSAGFGARAAPLFFAFVGLATPAASQAVSAQPSIGAAATAPNIEALVDSMSVDVPPQAHPQAPPDALASSPDLGAQIASAAPRPEPDLFGFTTLRLGETIYDDIWREASARPWPDQQPELDAFVARLRALPTSERIDEANAWINARVRFGYDPNLINHHWAGLAQTLARGRGEREDIAIAKMQLLAAAGVPRSDLYLVLVSDVQRLRPDALLVVRDADRVYVLDSKQNALVDQQQVGRYVPIIALGYEGKWIFGHRVGGRRISVAANQGRTGGADDGAAALDVGQASYQSLLPRAR